MRRAEADMYLILFALLIVILLLAGCKFTPKPVIPSPATGINPAVVVPSDAPVPYFEKSYPR